MKNFKQYFITGLIVITPAFLTLYVLMVVFQFCDGILGRFINEYLKSRLGFFIPGLGLILSLCIVLFVGFMYKKIFSKERLFTNLEKWFSNLPLIKNIYPAFKQLVLFALSQKEFGFQKVVLVEYPSKGIWSIGFLTNEPVKKINVLFDKEMVPVFVPSSPGPLTGYVLFVPREGLKFPDISVNDALKIIISGGVLTI